MNTFGVILFALTTVLGDGVQTNIVIESEQKETLGLTRQVLFGDSNTNLIDRSGVVVEYAATVAVDVAADTASEIGDAAHAAATNATEMLLSVTNQIAKYAKSFMLAVAPETVRSNVTGFVVKTTTDGATDTQYVWYNGQFTQKPTRWVEYQGDFETQAVKAVWANWTAAGETVTHAGRTWSGCHRCTVQRPAFAVGKPCLDLPNEMFGDSKGFSRGDVNILLDGVAPVTGVFTNAANHKIEYYDAGVLTNEETYNE